ncbi:hypothetical protein [Pyxidicoccus trucidator]|uniref:hypothetical protein n=1 Tax=Pyxidicoccus trucidator TaxID=2709662 RepID=UPI0013D9854F|nr:hypothetical protein [Pyxidicoccus trucidator]
MTNRITQALPADALEAVDSLLLARQHLYAIRLLKERTGCSLPADDSLPRWWDSQLSEPGSRP